MKYFIYHICRIADKGNLTKGYIGITSNVSQRWAKHKRGITNPHLKNALEKYDDVEFYLISSGSKDEITRMEKWLRPNPDIGWNCAEGGGLPPHLKGHKWSEETNKRRSETMKSIDRSNYPSQIGVPRKGSKPFVLISPEGERFEFEATNIEWINERGLYRSHVLAVIRGARKSHKGWTGHYL